MLIASRSFLKLTNHHVQNPVSEDSRVPTTYPSKAGESIYIHPTALINFISDYLPKVKFPFVLYSGDSDTTVPDDVREQANVILRHPLLLRWYSQNCTKPSEKLKQLPIGLDLHTLETRNIFWGPIQTSELQLDDIHRVKSMFVQKQHKCYSNFHFLINSQDRRDALIQVPKNLVFYEPRRLTRIDSWTNMINYKFVLSPHGNGLDCHRTWEAIILGCIPIMKTSALDPMFDGLPVLIVKNWSDVTQDLLDTFVPQTNLEKLYTSYWI
jgi:hypothetical protein